MSNHSNYIPDVGGHVPEDKDQRLVRTPYGDGMIIRTRNRCYNHDEKKHHVTSVKIYEIELQSWKKTPIPVKNGSTSYLHKPTMLYTSILYPSIEAVIGNEVVCLYGRGKLIDIRQQSEIEKSEAISTTTSTTTTSTDSTDDDHNNKGKSSSRVTSSASSPNNDVYIVKLTSWRLTERCIVKCYLQKNSIYVVRSKKLYEMNVYERIERGMELKLMASQYFTSKQYESALSSYTLAIDAVRYIQHQPHTPNTLRADLLIIMITCYNNAATCCTQLKLWSDAKKHAKNAEILIDALQEKAVSPITNGTYNGTSVSLLSSSSSSPSKIHAALNKDGYSDIKLFGEFKIKSMILYARSFHELGELESAVETIKKAMDIVESYIQQLKEQQQKESSSLKTLESNHKELQKLLRSCKEKKKKQLEKEKLRAQAMFGGGGATNNHHNNKASSSSSPSKETTTSDKTKNGGTMNGATTNHQDNNNGHSAAKPTLIFPESNIKSSNGQIPPLTQEETTLNDPASTKTQEKMSSSSSDVSEKGTKKKVTFSEDVRSRDIMMSDPSKNGNDDDDEWDYESIVGLSLLAGGAILGIALTYFMTSHHGRK